MTQRIQGYQPPPQKNREAKTTYYPILDKLIVWILQAPNETETGIQLPGRSQQTFVTVRAKVIAKGPDCKTQVKIGDVVLLPGSQYEVIRHRGYETLVVGETQIWGIEIPSDEEKT